MFKKLRFYLICAIFFLISVIPHLLRQAGVAFADEQLTITTYYPSPYGSYNELQLFPHSTPVTACNASTRGTMYYDSDDGLIKVCDGAGNWVSGGGYWATSPTNPNNIYNINTGNVGIGTTTPGAKLHVNGNFQISSGTFLFQGPTASSPILSGNQPAYAFDCPAGYVVTGIRGSSNLIGVTSLRVVCTRL